MTEHWPEPDFYGSVTKTWRQLGSGRQYDLGLIEQMERALEEAADALDETGRTAPAELDAGPLQARLVELLQLAASNAAELVMRIRSLAALLGQARERYEISDQKCVDVLSLVLNQSRQAGE